MRKNNYNTQKLITEMKDILSKPKTRKLTLEGLVYGEDGEEMMDNKIGHMQRDGVMSDKIPMQRQHDHIPHRNGDEEYNPLDEDPEVAKLITHIRVSTLEGLRKLAQNPESAQYELLKKIFLLIDKAVEDKLNQEK